jgi:hypothetical protein
VSKLDDTSKKILRGGRKPAGRKKAESFRDQDKLDAFKKRGGGPRPSPTASSAPAQPFGEPYAGGDAWRSGAAGEDGTTGSGTSIFDPVLCELVYRWFSPPAGVVLDPFAGGSVRGIVASKLGRGYVGVDLRSEQLEANREQAEVICAGTPPRWVCGDSRELGQLAAGEYDLVFTCPPYGDLERYSDDPNDLSTMGYPEFLASFRMVVAAAVALLRRDRFAAVVVGDFRDSRGMLNNFPADTIAAFRDAGCSLHNEAILVTAVGSLPIRAGRQFAAGRKLGKTHQQLLVFVKGDVAKAVAACGDVEVAFPEGMLDPALDRAPTGAGETTTPPAAGVVTKYGEEMP